MILKNVKSKKSNFFKVKRKFQILLFYYVKSNVEFIKSDFASCFEKNLFHFLDKFFLTAFIRSQKVIVIKPKDIFRK